METSYYKVIIEPQEEGGFTAYVPKLPGCVSQGETYQEAYQNIQDALKLYIEVAKERQIPVSEDDIHISEVCVSL